MRPVVRSWVCGLLGLGGVLWLLTWASGCAQAEDSIPWSPMPDYSAPPEPSVAPNAPGDCAAAHVLGPEQPAPCAGLLLPASEVQFLYDTEEQAQPVRDLLRLSVEGRERDRSWGDAHYARIMDERNSARRQRLEAFAVGTAVGFGICGGVLGAVALSLIAP